MKQNQSFRFLIAVLTILLFNACDKNEVIPSETSDIVGTLKGTGSFVYTDFAPMSNKPTNVYYHIPVNTTAESQILIVFHGASRDALENRNALIDKANQYNTIVVVPDFSEINFPGGDGYNLGNVFIDGDNPSSSTLNPEDQWAFSLIEPLFDYIKKLSGNNTATYDVFGFSAGGQFAHRFAFFKPNARFDKLVSSSSGWFTMPDSQVDFPYGIKESPVSASAIKNAFGRNITVMIGENDNNPNEGGLRRNAEADAQGTNRLARAQYFYNQSNAIANEQNTPFNWQYQSIPNVAHEFAATSTYAFDRIFSK
jgi:pimeloyl-ACP methyl ester carboxylesterase